MARVKTDKELEQEKAEKAVVETSPVQDTAASQESEQSAETKVEDTAKETAQEEIPTWIDKILKSFKNFDELYITKNGGVFTKGTPKHLVASATLYKNPYYKK